MEQLHNILKSFFSGSKDGKNSILDSLNFGADASGGSEGAGKAKVDVLKSGAVELKKLLNMFHYASPRDMTILIAGTMFAMIHGACFPAMAILFSSFCETFIMRMSNGFNSTAILAFSPNYSFDPEIEAKTIITTTEQPSSTLAKTNPSMEDIFGSIGGSLGLSGSGVPSIPLTDQEFVSHAILLTIYFICIGLVVFLSSFLQTICWETAGTNQVCRIRQRFLYQVLRQEISWFDNRPTGYLVSKLADDVERMREGMGHKFGVIIQYSASFGFGVFFALCTNWKLALVFGSSVPLIIAKIIYLLQVLVEKSIEQQEEYGRLGTIAAEVLAEQRIVAAYGTEIDELDRYWGGQDDMMETAKWKYKIVGLGTGALFFLIYGTFALAFWYAGNQLAQNVFHAGEVYTVFFSVSVGVLALVNILPFVPDIANAYGCSRIVAEILCTMPKIDPYSKDGQRPHKIYGKIKLSNVTFSYPSRLDTSVLRDLSFTINAGQTVAIIGASASGKSTIAKLLLRFYDPRSGYIMFDDIDLKNLNLGWLREQIGYVSQELAFDEATILDNLRSGRSDIPLQKVLHYASLTTAHDFITRLPKGYKTVIGITLQLSTGQRQLISLTRALLRNPKLLIMDEALSGVDSFIAGKIYKNIFVLRRDCTNIIITHRVLRVQNVDEIFVIVDGQLREHGDPKTLLEQGGIFSQMIEIAKTSDEGGEITELIEGSTESEKHKHLPGTLDACIIPMDDDGHIDSTSDIMAFSPWEGLWQLFINREVQFEAVFALIGCAICGSITVAFALVFSQMLITTAQESDGKLLAEVFYLVKLLVIVGIAAAIGYFVRAFYISMLGELLTKSLQGVTYVSILRESMSWFDQKAHAAAKLYVQLASNAPFFKVAIGSGLASAISTLVAEMLGLTFAILMAWQLSVILVPATVLFYACIQYGIKSYRIKEDEIAGTLADSLWFATKSIQNIRIVQSLCQQHDVLHRYSSLIHNVIELRQKQGISLAIAIALSNSWAILTLASVFAFSTYLVVYEIMKFSILFKIFVVLGFCVFTASHVISFTPDLVKAEVAYRNVLYFYEAESAIDAFEEDGEMPECLTPIVFDNVKFSYPQRPDKWILQGVSFKADVGVCLGIIGGEGKSTLLHLMERYYDPSSGQVSFGGVSVPKLKLNYLRKNIGLVPQEPLLFNRSIFENIAHGLDEEEMEDYEELRKKVERVAESVGINDSWHLPKGFETVVGEFGCRLTGGQKQKVTIARALMRDPEILLLDEPTSALGPEEEQMVLSTIKSTRKGRTCIIASNNPRVIREADMVAVMKHGKICEFGSPAELLELRGEFYKFMHANVVL